MNETGVNRGKQRCCIDGIRAEVLRRHDCETRRVLSHGASLKLFYGHTWGKPTIVVSSPASCWERLDAENTAPGGSSGMGRGYARYVPPMAVSYLGSIRRNEGPCGPRRVPRTDRDPRNRETLNGVGAGIRPTGGRAGIRRRGSMWLSPLRVLAAAYSGAMVF